MSSINKISYQQNIPHSSAPKENLKAREKARGIAHSTEPKKPTEDIFYEKMEQNPFAEAVTRRKYRNNLI